jgi:hypothetical protein
LDFYHLSENVHRCRRRVFGEDDAAGHDWAATLLHTLKHEGYAPAWDQLTCWRAALRGPVKKAAADRLLNYISERREMLAIRSSKAVDGKSVQVPPNRGAKRARPVSKAGAGAGIPRMRKRWRR